MFQWNCRFYCWNILISSIIRSRAKGSADWGTEPTVGKSGVNTWPSVTHCTRCQLVKFRNCNFLKHVICFKKVPLNLKFEKFLSRWKHLENWDYSMLIWIRLDWIGWDEIRGTRGSFTASAPTLPDWCFRTDGLLKLFRSRRYVQRLQTYSQQRFSLKTKLEALESMPVCAKQKKGERMPPWLMSVMSVMSLRDDLSLLLNAVTRDKSVVVYGVDKHILSFTSLQDVWRFTEHVDTHVYH